LEKRSYDADGSIPDLDYIHDTQFCTDVSEWTKVEMIPKTMEKCNTTFDKDRQSRRKTVCSNVTELKCDIVPYTECELKWINKPIKAYKDKKVVYKVKGCNETTASVKHNKLVPHCVNETKLNCVTLWKTDEDGNQVWAGNEDCEEVTWKKCELRPKEVDFPIVEMKCGETDEVVTWDDCEEYEEEKMTTQLTCNVLHTTNCEPKVTEICRDIEYDEWFEIPKEDCSWVTMLRPRQTFEHKKKCLFHDNGNGQAPAPKHSHHGHHHHHHEHSHGNEDHGDHESARLGSSLSNRRENSHTSNGSNRVHIGIHASPTQKSSLTHPSLNGFELHRGRNGKSISSNITTINSTSKNQIPETPDKKALLERNAGNPYRKENKTAPAQTFHIGKKLNSNEKLLDLLNIEILKTRPEGKEKLDPRMEYPKALVTEIKK
jgi:hypothetical protein